MKTKTNPWNKHKNTIQHTYHTEHGQIWRAGMGEGHPLPKPSRSRYAPHVGKKQLAKIAAR